MDYLNSELNYENYKNYIFICKNYKYVGVANSMQYLILLLDVILINRNELFI